MATDSDTKALLEPLLDNAVDLEAGPPEPQHFCARCSSELELNQKVPKKWTSRLVLIVVSMILSVLMFAFAVAQMAVVHGLYGASTILELFVALWTSVTLIILGTLLYKGGRNSKDKLGRTTFQIKVLCALGVSWIGFLSGLTALNHEACNWIQTCGLHTTVNVLTWLLVFACKSDSLLLPCLKLVLQCSLRHTRLIVGLFTSTEPAWSPFQSRGWCRRGVFPKSQRREGSRSKLHDPIATCYPIRSPAHLYQAPLFRTVVCM
ncbi:hypothetical protein B0H15DRAFT_869053 [Mycena belliarum]|uniref:Transmembrane protein n=1 Tax=Mycena belliarum TaxID=1033014 RepID=A0AAD6XIP6_9AGAR|nr:hypothetical protein B0H15DRAFT_869053 [Mycena belliae]